MRIASIRSDGGLRIGVVNSETDGVAILPAELGTVDDIVRGGQEALAAVRVAASAAPITPLLEVDLAPPVSAFNRDILATGWNYWDHFEESKGKREGQDPADRPQNPTFFTKGPGTVVGPYDDIAFDPELSSKWDYEAEVAIVIGRTGRSITEQVAPEHIFGYCVANDISQRDLQRRHGGQWLKGKSIDGTMPLGPWITTPEDVPSAYDLTVQCEVNGVRLQDASTAQVAFSFSRLIAELSWGMTLHAGDVILTGTPSGIGNAREPQVFLKDGDSVVTRVTGLGELRNLVSRVALT